MPVPLQVGAQTFHWDRPLLMGILNVTPDSFSDGGKFMQLEAALEQAANMISAGADMVDVGGQSTRPGSLPVSAEEELKRVLPTIRELGRQFPQVPISIDTDKATVAAQAVEAGASMINDISALNHDPAMRAVAARLAVPVVLMHSRGRPEIMQVNPHYQNASAEVIQDLTRALAQALDAGIHPDRVILDPGIGFGKALEHNLSLLKHLSALVGLGKPVLVGTSRKAFIGKILGVETHEREEGTLATLVFSRMQGAHLFRVHAVRAAQRALLMTDAMMKAV